MSFGVSNRLNKPIAIINVFWCLLLLYQFFFRIPEFENERPDGASYLITGLLLLTFFILLISVISILMVNIYVKIRFYTDLHFALIPAFLCVLIVFIRL
jgi:hypothetical protein